VKNKPVNIHEAKTHLSRLVGRVERGEEIIIARAGRPVARLVPIQPVSGRRVALGLDRGKVWIADDFDAELPKELLDEFYK
jgi:prevent-host-death family protein